MERRELFVLFHRRDAINPEEQVLLYKMLVENN